MSKISELNHILELSLLLYWLRSDT